MLSAWVVLLFVVLANCSTFFSFSRRIETCDPADNPIEDATTTIVWAYNDNDPVDNTSILQHQNRGVKSVRFYDDQVLPALPSDAKYFDTAEDNEPIVFNDPVLGPNTQYWCKGFKFEMPEKRQIIRIEPIIQQENLEVVHHILVNRCPVPLNDTELAWEGGCYSGGAPQSILQCNGGAILGAWAVGGNVTDLPSNAGLPVNGTFYVVMEVHYNNLQGVPIVDSSGLRFWHTGQLRQYDAGVFTVGATVGSEYYGIPPGLESYTVNNWCPGQCSAQFPTTGINATGVLLHAHLAGRELYLHQYRNGTELAPIAQEPYYNFAYQQMTTLQQERVILPGDTLMMECVYNTVDRTQPTTMGFTTMNEMCLAFILYYPLIDQAEYCIQGNSTLANFTPWVACGVQESTFFFLPEAPVLQPYSPPVCNYTPPPLPPSTSLVNGLNKSFYTNQVTLDDEGIYQLYWTMDLENGVYHAAVEVQTHGWVGLGISSSGGMADSDVFIGWQKNGQLYFADRYAFAQGIIPVVDRHQDFYNIQGGEVDNTPQSSSLVNQPTKIGVSVAGSVIGVICIALVVYFCLRRTKKVNLIQIQNHKENMQTEGTIFLTNNEHPSDGQTPV